MIKLEIDLPVSVQHQTDNGFVDCVRIDLEGAVIADVDVEDVGDCRFGLFGQLKNVEDPCIIRQNVFHGTC